MLQIETSDFQKTHKRQDNLKRKSCDTLDSKKTSKRQKLTHNKVNDSIFLKNKIELCLKQVLVNNEMLVRYYGKPMNIIDFVKKAIQNGLGEKYKESISILMRRLFGEVDNDAIIKLKTLVEKKGTVYEAYQILKLHNVNYKSFKKYYENKIMDKEFDLDLYSRFLKVFNITAVRFGPNFVKDCIKNNIGEVCVILGIAPNVHENAWLLYSVLTTIKKDNSEYYNCFKVLYYNAMCKLESVLNDLAILQ